MSKKILKVLIIIIIISVSIIVFIGSKVLINNSFIRNYDKPNNEVKMILLSALNIYEPYVAHYNYGNYYYKEEMYEEAIDKYRKTLEYDIPKSRICDVKINLGLSLVKLSNMQRKKSETIKLLKEAQSHLKDCIELKIDIDDNVRENELEDESEEKDENGSRNKNGENEQSTSIDTIDRGNLEDKDKDDEKRTSDGKNSKSDLGGTSNDDPEYEDWDNVQAAGGKNGLNTIPGGGSNGEANSLDGRGDGGGDATGTANGKDNGGKGEGTTSGKADNASGRGTSSNIGNRKATTLKDKQQKALNISDKITLKLEDLLNQVFDFDLPKEDAWDNLDEDVKINISKSEVGKETCLKVVNIVYNIITCSGTKVSGAGGKKIASCDSEDTVYEEMNACHPAGGPNNMNSSPGPLPGTGAGGTAAGRGDDTTIEAKKGMESAKR